METELCFYAWFPVCMQPGEECCILRLYRFGALPAGTPGLDPKDEVGDLLIEYHLEGTPYLIRNDAEGPLLAYRQRDGTHYLIVVEEGGVGRHLLGSAGRARDEVGVGARTYVSEGVLYSGCYAGRMASMSVRPADLLARRERWKTVEARGAPTNIGAIIDMELGGSAAWRTLEEGILDPWQAFAHLTALGYESRVRDARRVRVRGPNGEERLHDLRLMGWIDHPSGRGFLAREPLERGLQRLWLLTEGSLLEVASGRAERWVFREDTGNAAGPIARLLHRPCRAGDQRFPCSAVGTCHLWRTVST